MKISNLKKKYKNLLASLIDDYYQEKKKNQPKGRKLKFNPKFYLTQIFKVLFSGYNWSNLNCKRVDESTVRKIHKRWSDDGIYYIGYNIMKEKYHSNKQFNKLFIDSSIIQNYNCSDKMLNFSHKYRSKFSIKLNVICDSNKVPVSFNLTSPTVSDTGTIKSLLKRIQINVPPENANIKPIKLIGDKGYISENNRFCSKRNNFKLIHGYRRNQKTEITKNLKKRNSENNKLLKERHVVENMFCDIKKIYKRLALINERKLSNYYSFLVMGMTCQFIKALENDENEENKPKNKKQKNKIFEERTNEIMTLQDGKLIRYEYVKKKKPKKTKKNLKKTKKTKKNKI